MIPEKDETLRESLTTNSKNVQPFDPSGNIAPLNRKERRAKAKNKNYEIGHYQRIRNNDTHYHK